MTETFKAYDADLVDKQFRAVKLVDDWTVDFCTAAADLSIGMLNNAPKAVAGAACEVVMIGPCKAKLGGTVAQGQFLVPDSNGDLVAVSLGTTTTNVAVARAMEDGADDDVKQVWVNPGFVQV
jgi:hypothetical protein